MKRTMSIALLSATLLLAVSGCASVPDPATVPTELSVAELSQRGQAAFDDKNNKACEVYYQLIIDRYGTNLAPLTAAQYEIAHLRMREKKWDDAKARLETIIARYDGVGGAGLPPEYLVLAKNDLARIPATKVAATKVAATKVAATEVAATEVAEPKTEKK